MNFLITGTTGDVGSKVVEKLIPLGYRPRVFVRDRAKTSALSGRGTEIFVGDLGDSLWLGRALSGVDRLFLLNSGLASRYWTNWLQMLRGQPV